MVSNDLLWLDDDFARLNSRRGAALPEWPMIQNLSDYRDAWSDEAHLITLDLDAGDYQTALLGMLPPPIPVSFDSASSRLQAAFGTCPLNP